MDEQKKSRKKKNMRLIAAALIFCLMFTTYSGIQEVPSVLAEEVWGEDDAAETESIDLLEEEGEQILPEGTEEQQTVPLETEEQTVELLMRPYDEESSSDMVYYLEGSYDSYSWEAWDGEAWQEMSEYGPELTVDKEQWYIYRFRCIAERDGIRYTALAADDWQIPDLGIMTMAAAADSGQSSYMYYINGVRFNIRGIDGDKSIQTTFLDAGYQTASSTDGNKVQWNAASEVAMGNSLYGKREISLVYSGRYVMIKYTVENKGSVSQSFQVGSSADVMIDNNDFAPVVGTANGLSMSGEPQNSYLFNLVAPTADTLWYGYYAQAYDNMFTNLEDRSTEYTKDSGMAWSWRGTVAPGSKWSRYVLLGVGELPPAAKAPSLTNSDPQLTAGKTTNITGTAEPGNTVCIEVNGEEYSAVTGTDGKFTVPVTLPEDAPEGETPLNYWAVSPEGGISDVGTVNASVSGAPAILLTDTAVSVMEDSVLDDAWYRGFIKSSNGTVSYTSTTVKVGTPGTYTVTYTAKKTGFADAKATLTVTVLALPLELSDVTAARVSGQDSFTLSATLKHVGTETISETGFVWGIMQNPTTEMNNGKSSTSTVIKTKNGKLSVTAPSIADGVTYYARAYVRTSTGNIYYSVQKDFSISGKSYGAFTIKNNGNNTFTVTRTGGTDGTQKVYFRTVNGSAVGGTHFTHQASYLTFNQGETSKTITVTEAGVTAVYGGKTATAYSNADRTYQVEIYRVDGGGTLGSTTSATRTMTKNSSYTVDRTVYTTEKSKTQVADTSGKNGKRVADTTGGQGGTQTNVSFLTNRYKETNYNTSSSFSTYYTDANQRAYLNATAGGWYYRYVLKAYEDVDGYEYVYFGKKALQDKHYGLDGGNKGAAISGIDGQLWMCNFLQGAKDAAKYYNFPDTRTGGAENSGYPYKSSGTTVSYNSKTYVNLGCSDTCYLYFGATGADSDVWYVDGLVSYAIVYDKVEPQLLGVAPVTGTYKPGDKITVSLIFDEIVDSQNSTLSSVSLNTSWGTLSYAGGADTNVLYFTGTVPENASGTLKVNGITNASYIKDMCSTAGTASSGSGTVSVSVDNKKPTVAISGTSLANGTAKATVTGTNTDKLQYTWTQSSTMPVTGWLDVTSGQQVLTRQTSGTWYLHVMGTYTATGTMAHTYQSFNFSSGSTTKMPELTLSADNSQWAKSRTITVARTPSTATVTVKTPSGTTSTLTSTATSYTATANGTYTFTLKSDDETVVKSIAVSRIDRTAPAAVITGPNNIQQSENVTFTVTPSDAGGSGVKTVTGTWTRTTNGGTSTSVTATLTKNSDGTYTAKTPGTTGNNYTYRLNVTVTDNAGNTKSVSSNTYTVMLKVPTITVKKTASSSTGDTWSYTVAANGNTVTAVQLPDGTVTEALTGTFELTAPGTYYVTVSDAAGHVVRSTAMTVAAGVDGDAPLVRLYQADESWTNQAVRIEASIYEEGSIASATWKRDGTTAASTLSYSKAETSVYDGSFSVTQNGTYTVTVKDSKGNIGTASITVSNIDKTKPEVTCKVNATVNAKSGWYTASTVPIVLNFADKAGTGDAASGIRLVQYKRVTDKTIPTSGLSSLSDSTVSSGTYTYNLTSSYYGTYYLYYKVTDMAGNVTEGFSDIIQKDSYTGSATITGPSEGQPVSQGLAMHIKFWYGPAGGRLKAGTSAASAAQIAAMEAHAGTGTKTVEADYTAKISGLNRFYYYRYAVNGETDTTYSSWSFYVRQIDFNSQGGSAVESQLVWDKNNTTVYCSIVKPADPVRTGYTFGGWYTDAACTAGKEFDFTTQVRANTTLYAKWTANTYRVTYHLTNPNGSAYAAADAVKQYTYGQGLTLPKPAQTGFTFYGWYDNANYTGTAYTSVAQTATGDKNYYAYFKDTQTPSIQNNGSGGYLTGDSGWWRKDSESAAGAYISADYSDNMKVTEIWLKTDDGLFIKQDGFTAADRGTYRYYGLLDGEHTYTFKAVDAAGNETVSNTVTVKWDAAKPEIGAITYEKKAAGFLDWIVGKESLIVRIPVTDDVSGAKSLTYTETTVTPEGESTAEKTVSLSGKPGEQTVELTLDADWKGRISDIICTDTAGNVSDSKSIGGTGGGIIVEDNPPAITIVEADLTEEDSPKPGNAVSDEYYEEGNEPTLYVSVQDDGADSAAVTAGIKSITYTVGGGREIAVTGDFETKLTGSYRFTVPLTGRAGVVNVTVKAVDHAGNTAVSSIDVKIKGSEAVPEAETDYPKDVLANLAPNASYEITVPDGEEEVSCICTADGQGEIPLILTLDDGSKIDLCGRTVSIVKKGDGVFTSDSEAQSLPIEARPRALDPDTEIEVTPEIAEGAKDAEIKITIDVGPGTDDKDREYSTDGGKTWTDVPDDNIIRDLEPGDVIIRDKADDDTPAGEKATVRIPNSANTITAVFDLNYADADPDSAPAAQTGLIYTDSLKKPSDPKREGYDFVAWYQDAACQETDLWNFEENVTGDIIDKEEKNYELVDNIITVKLYAGWRENVAPDLSAVLTDGKDQKNWYQDLSVALTYSDNVGVTKLYVKKDKGAYTELNISGSTVSDSDSGKNAEYQYVFADLEEGMHTYTFKAEDAAGNVTETAALTARLDITKPVLGEASFDEGYKNLWDWIVRKDSLLITIPVSEAGSGIDAVEYTLMPEGQDQSAELIAKEAKVETGSGDGYTATISIEPSFKGRITVTARDRAGNVSDQKSIGTDGNGINGVIVEDNAPVITVLADRSLTDDASTQPDGIPLSEAYYNTAPRLLISVEDTAASGSSEVTSGLASVSWKIGDGEENPVGEDFQSSMKTSHSFTVIALEGKSGILEVTVKAVDWAGNIAEQKVTVHVKTTEEIPVPVIDYVQEKLTELIPNAEYVIGEETVTADGQGCIEIREEWFDSDILIYKKGTENTLDSENVQIGIAARPHAPSVSKVSDETVKGKKDGVLTGFDGTMEYSVDGGRTWNLVEEDDIDANGCMANFTAGEVLVRIKATKTAPHGEETVVTVKSARTLTVTFMTNGGSSIAPVTGKAWNDTVTEPEEPVRAGYAFDGWYRDANCTEANIWHFASEQTGTGEEADRLTGDVTLYAKWRESQPPRLNAVLTDGKDAENWDSELSVTLTYSDNVGVTNLYAKKDDGEYVKLDMSGSAVNGRDSDGNTEYQCIFNDVEEGEHTYAFKAEDAAGNVTETGPLTARLDTAEPVLGEEFFNEGYKNFWNWIIRKKSLIVTLPVIEKGSGIAEDGVSYTLTDEDGTVISRMAEVETGTDESGDYLAKIVIDTDFKGSIQITATDRAGYVSAVKTIGTGDSGIIVEDYAPIIRFESALGDLDLDEWITDRAEVMVHVADELTEDGGDRLSGGIAEVTYCIDDGEETEVSGKGFSDGIVTACSFNVELSGAGEHTFRVTAVDNAGNSSTETAVVKIRVSEEMPSVAIDYINETLEGFAAQKAYAMDGEDIAVSDGKSDIEEEWFGKEVSVVCKGNGREFIDSEPQMLTIPARPDAPTGLLAVQVSVEGGKGAICGLSTDMEYRMAGNSIWTKLTDDMITDGTLATFAGSYEIRYQANEHTFASKTAVLDVPDAPDKPDTPDIPDKPDVPDTPDSSGTTGGSVIVDTPVNEDRKDGQEEGSGEAQQKPEQVPQENSDAQTVQAEQPERPGQGEQLEQGTVITGDTVATGNVTEDAQTVTVLEVGNGAVIVTVVCKDESYTAGVADTVAVANAILTPEQIQAVNSGETVEIRVDVEDISTQIDRKEKDVIEEGVKSHRKGAETLTVGMYIDISVFVKIGNNDWDAVTATKEPIEIVIGVPEELKSAGREYYVIRAHEGEYTVLEDMDSEPDTITIYTDLFSTYAIAYQQTDEAGGSHKCGLCHICPTFLGICYFIWLAIIMAAALVTVILVMRRTKKESEN